jgi:LPXTG-motif cell wall-anchored protein
MGRRLRTILVVACVLALGAMAAPVSAQESDFNVGGFTLAECAVAVAAASGEDLDEEQLAALQSITADMDLDEVLALMFPEGTGFAFDELPEGLTLEQICTIYGTDVLPEVDDRDIDDVDAVVDGRPTTPTQVLGVTQARPLALTGANVLALVLAGVVLVGLGFLALRRTRPQAS